MMMIRCVTLWTLFLTWPLTKTRSSIDHAYKGEGRRAIWRATTSTAPYLLRSSNVCVKLTQPSGWPLPLTEPPHPFRQDDKTAKELGVTAGAVLHLVLALRGGSCWSPMHAHAHVQCNHIFRIRTIFITHSVIYFRIWYWTSEVYLMYQIRNKWRFSTIYTDHEH